MPTKEATQSDAEIVLKLYEMRREPVMRESRSRMIGEFFPKTFDEAAAVMDWQHPFNAAFRQTSGYWEMAFSIARHGAAHFDLLIENCGEGLFLFAKFEPFIEELRATKSPTMFANTSWVIENSPWAKEKLEMIRQRIAQINASNSIG